MKEVVELTQADVVEAIRTYVGQLRKWEHVRVEINVYGPSQDGPLHSPGGVTARAERISPGD
jgi:hypothetical protein